MIFWLMIAMVWLGGYILGVVSVLAYYRIRRTLNL